MKHTIKTVINDFLIITVGIFFFTSVFNALLNWNVYEAVFPFQVILTGVVTSLPTLLFYFKTEPTKKQFFTRVAIHFVLIASIVMLEGRMFCWYRNIYEGLVTFLTVVLVYLLAWGYTFFMNNNQAKKINEALKEFNQDEEDK